MDFNLHSIPYDIANSMFETCRTLFKNDFLDENNPTNPIVWQINSIRN